MYICVATYIHTYIYISILAYAYNYRMFSHQIMVTYGSPLHWVKKSLHKEDWSSKIIVVHGVLYVTMGLPNELEMLHANN